jgi:hypothetical protein
MSTKKSLKYFNKFHFLFVGLLPRSVLIIVVEVQRIDVENQMKYHPTYNHINIYKTTKNEQQKKAE